MAPDFDNSYVTLPGHFYTRQAPVPVAAPELIRVNQPLAALLDIDTGWLESEQGIQTIAGNHVPDGADPIATVYAGHQFGSFNPRLGDGRAILLGEVLGTDGERYDLQLKGSGITPYSRNGDGRAPLGPILREYLVSEAMAVLGIPTSRTLAAVTTGEGVYREQRFPGGVLVRVARSHIRIGTIQYFASIEDHDGLSKLVDHVIARHYPEVADSANPALELYRSIAGRIASLIAHWQSVGFIHGVMNTDNMLLAGETIDYGPCAFMDGYDSAAVYSSIDHGSRYAYRNQPPIAQWNLACLGQSLLPLIDADEEAATAAAQAVLNEFPETYMNAWFEQLRKKFGLTGTDPEDERLMQDFLDLLEAGQHDFTLAFRRLGDVAAQTEDAEIPWAFPESFEPWLSRWQQRCLSETVSPQQRKAQMLMTNPAYIARNHLVEQAIQQAYAGDLGFFNRLYDRLQLPFHYAAEDADLAQPPKPHEIVQQTFCGT